MGNSSHPIDPTLQFYLPAEHPIEGEVQVYTLPGQGVYIMKKPTHIQEETIQLLRNIGNSQPESLVTLFEIEMKPQMFSLCRTNPEDRVEENEQSVNVYWEFLNFDLSSLAEREMRNGSHYLYEYKLVNILEKMAEAVMVLAKFGVYPEIKHKLIQFTSGNEPKLYWANILPKNMHRAYFRFFYLSEYAKTLYAPEELQSFKQRKINHKISLQKCVVFCLGLTILQSAANSNLKDLYEYKYLQFCEKKKRDLLKSINNHYSSHFIEIISKMVDSKPENRPNYKQIMASLAERFGNKSEETKNTLSAKVSLKNFG